MCSVKEATTQPVLTQQANKLGRSVWNAPRATTALLMGTSSVLWYFQPEGMLTQAFTMAAATSTGLHARAIYAYVDKHPLTEKVRALPAVQQCVAKVSHAVSEASALASRVKEDVYRQLFPETMPVNTGKEEKQEPPKEKDKPVQSPLVSEMNQLKQAFRETPRATAAALAVNVLALRLFAPVIDRGEEIEQPGFITLGATLAVATGTFFLASRLYGKYHNHPKVQEVWKHRWIKYVTNHDVTKAGMAFASSVAGYATLAAGTVSSFARRATEAYGRAFPKEATAAAQQQTGGVPVGAFPPNMTYQDLLKQLMQMGATVQDDGSFIFTPTALRVLMERFPKPASSQEAQPTRVRTQRHFAKPGDFGFDPETTPPSPTATDLFGSRGVQSGRQSSSETDADPYRPPVRKKHARQLSSLNPGT